MKFQKYNAIMKPLIDQFQLTKEQLAFVKSPQENIVDAQEDENRTPILVFNEQDEFVTFFVLHKHSEFEDCFEVDNSIYIRSFSTDRRFLRKGYAKATLLELPAFVTKEFPEIDYITLLVDVPNAHAKKMYEDCGFVAGKVVEGARYPAYTMIKKVSA